MCDWPWRRTATSGTPPWRPGSGIGPATGSLLRWGGRFSPSPGTWSCSNRPRWPAGSEAHSRPGGPVSRSEDFGFLGLVEGRAVGHLGLLRRTALLVLTAQQLEELGHLGGRRHLDRAVPAHPRARRDQLADDDVLLAAPPPLGLALDRGIGQHPRRLLEGGR